VARRRFSVLNSTVEANLEYVQFGPAQRNHFSDNSWEGIWMRLQVGNTPGNTSQRNGSPKFHFNDFVANGNASQWIEGDVED
jgi:hypothetical protein